MTRRVGPREPQPRASPGKDRRAVRSQGQSDIAGMDTKAGCQDRSEISMARGKVTHDAGEVVALRRNLLGSGAAGRQEHPDNAPSHEYRTIDPSGDDTGSFQRGFLFFGCGSRNCS